MKRSFLNSHAIEKMMATVIQQIQEPLPETLSPKLLDEHHLMPLTEALWNIHFPTNPTSSVGHNTVLNLKNCFMFS